MSPARTITTSRLTMTPHALSDFDDIFALWSDPKVVRFLGGVPNSEEECWARLMRYAGSWALLGFCFWAVRTHDGRHIGDVGFLEARRTGVTGFDGDPEIGWGLTTAAQGQGYATEAVQAALAWGAANFAGRFTRTVAMINPENAASLSVAARCGFRHFAVSRYKDAPTGLWEHSFPA